VLLVGAVTAAIGCHREGPGVQTGQTPRTQGHRLVRHIVCPQGEGVVFWTDSRVASLSRLFAWSEEEGLRELASSRSAIACAAIAGRPGVAFYTERESGRVRAVALGQPGSAAELDTHFVRPELAAGSPVEDEAAVVWKALDGSDHVTVLRWSSGGGLDVRLARKLGRVRSLAWTRDGRSLVVSELRADWVSRLSLLSAIDGAQRTVTEVKGNLVYLVPSPAGDDVLALRADPDLPGEAAYAVLLVDLSTGESKVVLSGPDVPRSVPSWSPNGDEIVFSASGKGRWRPKGRAFRFNIATGEATPLSLGANDLFRISFLSGTRFVLDRGPTGRRELWWFDAGVEGSGVRIWPEID